jgi:hypothetical protein
LSSDVALLALRALPAATPVAPGRDGAQAVAVEAPAGEEPTLGTPSTCGVRPTTRAIEHPSAILRADIPIRFAKISTDHELTAI